MRMTRRLAAALAIGTLVTAACGARLTPEQREQALSQGSGGGTTGGSTGVAAVTTGSVDPGATGAVTPGTTGATGTAGTTGSTGRTGTTGTTGGSTGTSGSTTGSTTGTPKDFVHAPPGGNGGKTDVGVTATTLRIGNVADVSGPVPGLFEDARFAVQAYVKYFTARYGTLYGRKLILDTYDSQLDAGVARSATIDLCQKDFAGVGSVTAFDQGAAQPTKDCGIPDLRGLATTDQMKAVPTVFPMNAAGTGGVRSLGLYGWAKAHYPQAIKKAGYIFIDGDVTRQTADQDSEAATAVLGYNFLAKTAIGITETNYAPVVRDFKSKGILYVTFVGAYQQAANLAKEFQRQNYKPTVFQPTVTAYTRDFISQAGAASEGVFVAVAPSLIEEINGNPELTTYAQWLRQVNQKAIPTAIGQFAWSAAALFVDEMIKIGPKPTRKALLAAIAKIHNYDGHGLFPGQDVGGRRLSSCTNVVRVQGGKFVRFEPKATRTVRCGDGVYDTTANRKMEGFPR